MRDIIAGRAFVVGDDVDTDQIIPAQHLVYSMNDPAERRMYGRFALSGVPAEGSGLPGGHVPFIGEGKDETVFTVLIAGKNFGCGSSREHAPFALRMAGVRGIVAVSYARIFFRNAVDGGHLTPYECVDAGDHRIRTGDRVRIEKAENRLVDVRTRRSYPLRPLGAAAAIVEAGGLFGYARKQGLLAGRGGR